MSVKIKTNANYMRSMFRKRKQMTTARIQYFLNALADEGIAVANPIVSQATQEMSGISLDGSNTVDYLKANPITKTLVKRNGKGRYTIAINFTGEDVMFIEFSAGVTYGTMPGTFSPLSNGDPYGDGYGVGTYPGQTHAFDDYWVYEKDGTLYVSVGNKAFMPMYHAADSMLMKIATLANSAWAI